MSGRKSVSITLRDLRVAKLEKKARISPCSKELDAYLSSLARFNDNDEKVPIMISKALANCMQLRAESAKPASLQFHLAKFVSRK
jgi:hypothetical protein